MAGAIHKGEDSIMLSSKKFLLGLAPLAAVLTFALAPAMAQAAVPVWKVNGTRIANGKAHAVKVLTTSAGLTLKALAKEATCKVMDKGLIWNLATGGLDEITEFTNTMCAGNICPTGTVIEITALRGGLPLGAANAWPTKLIIVAGVIRDEIKEIEIDVSCSGTLADTFTGTLTPRINTSNGTAIFGTGSGALKDKEGHEATVEGEDAVEGESGEVVSVAEE